MKRYEDFLDEMRQVRASLSDRSEPSEKPERDTQIRPEAEDETENPEGAEQNQDPGHRQKQNQPEKDDPLAA